ncbi:hypothetical protein R3P38DRAFT_2536029 [Favolaschia claudopus]|uniref:Uncharacterized protein n=1 Tax=Favolaschia claudopus TaxID=2862362 RepID=A0AAW0B3A3_9AGAR
MAKTKKRTRQRVPKENRKNLRLWAEGARETILTPHLDAYQAALDQGRRQERKMLKKICREFHARVDWRTKDHEEPMLSEWDPAGIATEEELSEDDEVAKRARIEELNKASHIRIRRWFMYRLKKLRKNQRTGKDIDPRRDPYSVLMANLSGVTSPPKALQAYQQFMRESYEEKVAPVVAQRWEQERIESSKVSERTKEPKAGFRAEVAREVFAQLSDDERKAIGDRAKKEAAVAKAAYLDMLKSPPSQSPEARQRCIENVPDFMGPILQGLHTHTGLHATLIMGGPMPEFGGEIRTLHVSYGRNLTTLGPHWPQWDKMRFGEVTKFMTEYLHTAYTPQQCAQSALNKAADLSGASYTINDGADDNSDSSTDSDSSDTDSSDSDSDSESDQEEEKRVRKKRKANKENENISGRWQLIQTPASTYPFISEAERQQNIRRNQNLLNQLKSDVAGDLNALKGDMGKKKTAKASTRSTKAAKPPAQSARETRSSRSKNISTVPQQESESDPSTSFAHEIPAPAALAAQQSLTPNSLLNDHPPAATEENSDSFAAHDSPPSQDPSLDDDSSLPLPPVSRAAHSAIATSAKTRASTAQAIPLPSMGPPACPPNAAKWFADAHAVLTSTDLGCHYHAVVAAWTRMEVASRFENSPTNLTSKLRPKQVGAWIARNRRGVEIVMQPAEYASQWQSWWDSLQPSWRIKDKGGSWAITASYGGGGREWGPLYRWGVNGALTIVASLYFWGLGVVSQPEFRSVWESAVQDVCWMFEGMATYYEMFKGKF